MVAPYILEGVDDGRGGSSGVELVSAKPRNLRPLGGEASEDRVQPSSVQSPEERNGQTEDVGVRPMPPERPRPPSGGRTSPKLRQLHKSASRRDADSVAKCGSGASTTDTAVTFVLQNEATDVDLMAALQEKAAAILNPHTELPKRAPRRRGTEERRIYCTMESCASLAGWRAYLDSLYAKAEQLILWKLMEEKAIQLDLLCDEDGPCSRIQETKTVDLLGELEAEIRLEPASPRSTLPLTRSVLTRRQSAFILTVDEDLYMEAYPEALPLSEADESECASDHVLSYESISADMYPSRSATSPRASLKGLQVQFASITGSERPGEGEPSDPPHFLSSSSSCAFPPPVDAAEAAGAVAAEASSKPAASVLAPGLEEDSAADAADGGVIVTPVIEVFPSECPSADASPSKPKLMLPQGAIPKSCSPPRRLSPTTSVTSKSRAATNKARQELTEALKTLLTAKKVKIGEVRETLERCKPRDVKRCLETPLDLGPPFVPKPLVVAVATNDPKLVELLIEFNARVEDRYDGPAMYKGWVKPGCLLVESVGSRKGRFIGTMLGDRLQQIEETLQAAKEDCDQAPPSVYASEEPDALSAQVSEEFETGAGDAEEPSTLDAVSEAISAMTLSGPRGSGRFMSALGASEVVQVMDVGGRRIERCSTLDCLGNLLQTCVTFGTENGKITHTQGHPKEFYDLSAQIGDGDTSTVWKATHSERQDVVAIKVENKSDEFMIWEEIAIMRKISHLNIARLVETFENDTQVFMVLELCEGGTLQQAAFPEGTYAPELALSRRSPSLIRSIIRPISYLHSKGVCHRGLQLDNYLLSTEGDLAKADVKLIDFTTAKEFGPGKDAMKTKICIPSYVAREILTRSIVPYTEKVDVWSLGVVLFVLLCGHFPFVGDTDFAILKRVKKSALRFEPLEVWSEVPDQARDLVKHMMNPRPEERWSAGQALRHNWFLQSRSSIS